MRDPAGQLDALAYALRHISRETTRLRRAVAADAQWLVDLERPTDRGLRSLRRFQRQIQEPR